MKISGNEVCNLYKEPRLTGKTEEEGFHGFGMKSMKLIAEKYGGSLSVSADGDLFTLDVYLMKN